MADRCAQALQAPVGVHDRPVLLGVALGREDEVGVLADAVGEEGGVGDDRVGALERQLPPGAPGQVGDRIGVQEVQHAQLAPAGGGGDLGGVAAGALDVPRSPGRRWAARPPRPARGRWWRCGTHSRPEPSPPRLSAPASCSSARAACAARAPETRRSPKRITTSGPACSARARRADGVGVGARRLGEAVGLGPLAGLQRGRQRHRRRPRRRRARSATLAAALASSDDGRLVATASLTPWRRTPLRMRRSTIGMSSTGSQSSTRTAWANSRSATVACASGADSARCSASGSVPPVRESMSGESRPSRSRRCSRKASSLVLSPPTIAPTRPLARASAGGRLVERALPGDRAQLAAVADHRRGDALVDVDRLVGEAALVAQPAVVDLGVVAPEHAQHALVAHGEGDVALRRAQRAHRARALDVPRARAEAVGLRGQRPHRAQLDDVAAERRDVGVPVEGRDVGVRRRAPRGPAGSPRRSPG